MPPLMPTSKLVNTLFVPARLVLDSRHFLTPGLKQALGNLIEHAQASIVHDNGVWLGFNRAVAHVAGKTRVHLVISTRGMLEPWALQFGVWKKRIAWEIYQERIIRGACLLHATSDSEAEHLRELGLMQPIAVVPNGVTIPGPLKKDERSRSEKRTILYLSRIHPKKGLLNLVKALAILQTEDWQIVIAGPDELNHRAEVQKAAEEAGVSNMVRFVGAIPDDEKWSWFRKADLFVLPTYSENFGIVVIEALASGVPVITTKGAPWQELVSNECGWWIDIGVEPLVEALREATVLPEEHLQRMGENGRRLVETKYSWEQIGAQMAAVYSWLTYGTSRPDWVYL